MEYLSLLPIVGVIVLAALVPLFLRRVVEPNEVHIVQSKGQTTAYGRGQVGGNAYYEWPSWLPVIGIQTIKLPLSNFSIALQGYAAYDSGRLPLELDVIGFFRVENPSQAAERISSIDELRKQLEYILQGAVRTVLAKADVEKIMGERSTFGEAFTSEVLENLREWGVAPVKSIELMDIRDGDKGVAITNIMAKKSSQIEKESRVEVANNKRAAAIAETEAKRDADVVVQQAAEQVGQRTALQEQSVGIAKERAKQEIATEARTTAEKNMAVQQVQLVRAAEIRREQEVIHADEDRQKTVIAAEAHKQNTVISAEAEKLKSIAVAEGHMQAKKMEAVGIKAEGEAKANAQELMQVATEVAAQAALANVIGTQPEYQNYLVRIATVEANRIVGVEQAKALTAADIRVVVDGTTPSEGMGNVMDLFSGKGGTNLGKMVETFAQTPVGEAALKKLGIARPNGAAA